MSAAQQRAPHQPTSPILDRLQVPVVLAPMAGAPGTPQLAAQVSNRGALGFLAAGYLTPTQLSEQIKRVRAETDQLFGVNVFATPSPPGDPGPIAGYTKVLAPLAARCGVALGQPVHDDDHLAEKIEVLLRARPAVASFTFGPPDPTTADRLRSAGIEVWVTVTDPAEATIAADVGAQVLVAQGSAAGGHRGSFVDHDDDPLSLHDLLAALTATDHLPVVAAGGIMSGADLARVLDAGAAAGQLGTAFLLCPEAGTHEAHRRALLEGHDTVLTRAFSGRRARSIPNRWTATIGAQAPSAYPEIHHLTAPLRTHGSATNNRDIMNLWAGTGHRRIRALSASELIDAIAAELDRATRT